MSDIPGTPILGDADGVLVGPPHDPDRYELLSEAGRGNQGRLWVAHARLPGETVTRVAVKQLSGSNHVTPGLWQEQYNLLASIDSVAIARVREMFFGAPEHRRGTVRADTDRDLATLPYQVMSWLDGLSLHEWLAEYGETTTVSERLALLTGPASALDALHGLDRTHAPLTGQRWIAHGDVKPGNVVVTRGEERIVKLVDFGCTRIDQSPPATLHTAPYSPPWIRSGLAGTPVADRYALLCTLAHAIVGAPPPVVTDAAGGELHVDVGKLTATLGDHLAKRPALRDALVRELTAPEPRIPRPDGLVPMAVLLGQLRDVATTTTLPKAIGSKSGAAALPPVPAAVAAAPTTAVPVTTTLPPAPAPVQRNDAAEAWRRRRRRRTLRRTGYAAVAAGLVALGLGPARPTVDHAIVRLEALGNHNSGNTGTSTDSSGGSTGGVVTAPVTHTPAPTGTHRSSPTSVSPPVVEHTTPPVIVPRLTASTPARTVNAGDLIRVSYGADRLGSGQQLLLQRSVDGGGWTTVKTLSGRSGSTSTQVPMGKKTYRVAAVSTAGKTLSSATAGTVYSFGTVSLGTLVGSHSVKTTTTGTRQFRYVFSGNAQSLFWNEGADGNKAWDVTSSACRSISVDVAGSDSRGDGDVYTNPTFFRITRENADPASVTVPVNTIGHLNATLTPGTSWGATIGGSYFMYLNGTASCWSTSPFIQNS